MNREKMVESLEQVRDVLDKLDDCIGSDWKGQEKKMDYEGFVKEFEDFRYDLCNMSSSINQAISYFELNS